MKRNLHSDDITTVNKKQKLGSHIGSEIFNQAIIQIACHMRDRGMIEELYYLTLTTKTLNVSVKLIAVVAPVVFPQFNSNTSAAGYVYGVARFFGCEIHNNKNLLEKWDKCITVCPYSYIHVFLRDFWKRDFKSGIVDKHITKHIVYLSVAIPYSRHGVQFVHFILTQTLKNSDFQLFEWILKNGLYDPLSDKKHLVARWVEERTESDVDLTTAVELLAKYGISRPGPGIRISRVLYDMDPKPYPGTTHLITPRN